MAKNAMKILSNDEELARFKKQAYDHSLNFGLDKIVPMYEAIYDKVVEGKKI